MILRFHPAAAKELTDQVAYYSRLNRDLGTRFYKAVTETLSDIRAMPERFRIEANPAFRRAGVFGFPHHLIFRQVSGTIQILAVAHNRRKPGYWQERM